MTYRDPREALQAENDCLRQELKEAREELASASGVPSADDYERRRWALGMRCLGSLAMMAPFLAMMSMAEHRAMRRAAWHSNVATAHFAPAGTLPRSGCPRAMPAVGFEHFTQSIERPAHVDTSTVAGVAAGSTCTVRVAPVSLPDFNCHVEVVCGGRTVYGALPQGYAHCDVGPEGVTRAYDADPTPVDGDAAITADITHHQLTLTDRAGTTTSRLVLLLDHESITR